MNIRRVLSTTAAGAAIVLGVTACGGASDTSKNWFAAYCEGLQSLQSGDLSGAGNVATNLKSLPAPDVDGGQAFADSQVALFEALADPANADPSTLTSLGDMSQFANNSGLEEAIQDTPQCSFLGA